jgi:hypothetical protein
VKLFGMADELEVHCGGLDRCVYIADAYEEVTLRVPRACAPPAGQPAIYIYNNETITLTALTPTVIVMMMMMMMMIPVHPAQTH